MRPWLFEIDGLGVPAYWALLTIGFALAAALSWREARRDGIDPNRMLDLDLLLIVAGLVGARLMHALVEDDPLRPGTPILFHYLQHPLDLFKISNGLAFYGGVLLALPVMVWFARRHRLGVWKVADILALCTALGLVFGRLGCFMAGCCHGRPTDLPWAVTFEDIRSLARPLGVGLHPTQLLSAGYALLLFGLLFWLKRKRSRFEGQVFLSFVVLYSAGRFLIEFLRNDNRGMFFSSTLSASQLIAAPALVAGLAGIVWLSRRARSPGTE